MARRCWCICGTLNYQEIYEKDGDDGWLTSKASRPVMIESWRR